MLVVEEVAQGADEAALYQELYAGLATPMPELDESNWPAPAGIVCAREGGALRGWAVFFAYGREPHAAAFQWIMVERERERISTGFNTVHPGTETEVAELGALAVEAAGLAAEAGYTQLVRLPAEPDFAEGIARLLGARVIDGETEFPSYRLPLRPPPGDVTMVPPTPPRQD